MFMSGKIAMFTAGVWKISTYANITSFNWDVVQLPLDPKTGERKSSSNMLGWIINPNTKNLDAAVKLLSKATNSYFSFRQNLGYGHCGLQITRWPSTIPPFGSDNFFLHFCLWFLQN